MGLSSKLHAGLYSWAGAVSEGSYFGDDDELFISMLVSGAEGRYILKLRVSLGVHTELTVYRNQDVQISGERTLPAPPVWGNGGFVVGLGGSLALEYVALLGSQDIDTTLLTVLAGGRLSVADSLLVPPSVTGMPSWVIRSTPLPCDGEAGACNTLHAGAVMVTAPSTVSLAVPLVCARFTNNCGALPTGVTADQHHVNVAAGMPPNADARCFTGDYITVLDAGSEQFLVSSGGGPRCDAAPGFEDTWSCENAPDAPGFCGGGVGQGPFGLGQDSLAWYRLPAGRGLATEPAGQERCGAAFSFRATLR